MVDHGVSAILHVRRPFRWGILMLLDANDPAVPELLDVGSFAATATGVTVSVRHAQDIDSVGAPADGVLPQFSVTVACYVAVSPARTTHFDTVIDVQSGAVTIGDADHEDSVQLVRGCWRVDIATAPVDFPEHVDIWLNQLPGR